MIPAPAGPPSLAQLERRNGPHQPLNHALGLGLLLLTVLAMVRRNDHDGMLLGLPAVFFVTVMSRYYMALGALLFSWTGDQLGRRKRWLWSVWLWALLAVCCLQLLLNVRPRQLYLLLNTGMSIYFVEVVASFLVLELARLRRRLGAG